MIDKQGTQVVSYKYDSWGNQLQMTDTSADQLGSKNPFRYRGYFLDEETGLYYLGKRYYDSQCNRFISGDLMSLLDTLPVTFSDKNLYVYCDNNPIVRKDVKGNFWVAAVAAGIVTQYGGDVLKNLLSGKRGIDIFKPSSSVGEYIAAGVTAVIPGSGISASFIRNVVSEGIINAEKCLKGKTCSLKDAVINVAFGTTIDFVVDNSVEKVTTFIKSKEPKNWPTYSGEQFKKNRKKKKTVSSNTIYKNMRRSIRWNRRLRGGISFSVGSLRNLLPW